MPIRLNLLAEQQEAEEARRRDPVKRSIWAAGVMVAFLLVWGLSLRLYLTTAKAELNRYESQVQTLEENSKEARANWESTRQIQARLTSLQRYETNRFLCALLLDAVQQCVVDDIRVVELQSSHSYSTNPPSTVKTNLDIPIASRKHWQFRAAPGKADPVQTLVSNQLALLTSRLESGKSSVPLATKVDLSTNGNSVRAQIEITKPAVAVEHVVLVIKARDYSNGKRVDAFSKALGTHPYFAQRLRPGEGEGIRLRERAIQPELDPTDPVAPARSFVPFVIECRYQDTARANE